MNQQSAERKINGTFVIGVITVILTLIALIPAFLNLNAKNADIFYSLEKSQVDVPSTLDKDQIEVLLKSNGIPLSTLELKIINQGNAPADLIKISVSLPNDVISIWTTPSKKDAPIWVELPDIQTENLYDNFRYEIKNLDTTKPISINFGFGHSKKMAFSTDFEQLGIQVFYDGIPAVKVDDVTDVPRWSKWTILKLPALILAGGCLLVVLWSVFYVLYSDAALRQKVIEEFIFALKTNW